MPNKALVVGGSLGGLFAAQVAEHLEPDYLLELLEEAFVKLRPGSAIVLETINVASWFAFFSSYIRDLTHQRPIFPEVALALTQLAGFHSGYVLFPLGSGNLDEDRASRGEYAVVATAGA